MASPPADVPHTSAKNPRSILLTVAYDGTDFHGWQIQPEQRTVQGVLTAALEEMEGGPVKIRGAGRTDAGVHALGQTAGFTTRSSIPLDGYLKGLNSLLPKDLAVHSVRQVPIEFDARFWHCIKVYRYGIHNSPIRDPFLDRYHWNVRQPLDHEAMQRGGLALTGTHDFNAFRAADCERENSVRTVNRVTIRREASRLFVEVEGPAFLKYMVRVVVGTLTDVGRGKITCQELEAILASRDRRKAGPTAPPHGLTLVRVRYPELDLGRDTGKNTSQDRKDQE